MESAGFTWNLRGEENIVAGMLKNHRRRIIVRTLVTFPAVMRTMYAPLGV